VGAIASRSRLTRASDDIYRALIYIAARSTNDNDPHAAQRAIAIGHSHDTHARGGERDAIYKHKTRAPWHRRPSSPGSGAAARSSAHRPRTQRRTQPIAGHTVYSVTHTATMQDENITEMSWGWPDENGNAWTTQPRTPHRVGCSGAGLSRRAAHRCSQAQAV
jgi:hypothetical protein